MRALLSRLFSSWQGLVAGLLALSLYFGAPAVYRYFDPTAGEFPIDAGYLHWVTLAAFVYLGGIFFTWVGWQIAFPSTDKAADQYLADWFQSLTNREKWIAVQSTFLIMFYFWFKALAAIPLE